MESSLVPSSSHQVQQEVVLVVERVQNLREVADVAESITEFIINIILVYLYSAKPHYYLKCIHTHTHMYMHTSTVGLTQHTHNYTV